MGKRSCVAYVDWSYVCAQYSKDTVQYLSSLWKYYCCNSTNISMCGNHLSCKHQLGKFILPHHICKWCLLPLLQIILLYSAWVSAVPVITLLTLLTWSVFIPLRYLTRQCFWMKLCPKALPRSRLCKDIRPSRELCVIHKVHKPRNSPCKFCHVLEKLSSFLPLRCSQWLVV